MADPTSNLDLELSWRTFLMNRGAMSHDFYEVARIAFTAAWHAGWAARGPVETSEVENLRNEVGRLKVLAGPSGKSLGELEAINDSLLEENARLRAAIPPEEPTRRHPRECSCTSCHYSQKFPQVKPHHATCGCFECAPEKATCQCDPGYGSPPCPIHDVNGSPVISENNNG